MPKVSEAVAEYLDVQRARRGVMDDTLMNHLNILNMFVRISGDRLLSNLTANHVETFFYGAGGVCQDHLVKSGHGWRTVGPVSARTHNHYKTRLNTFFKWCQQKGYLKREVMHLIQPRRVIRQKRQRPSPVMLLQLIEAAKNPRDRAYIATAVNTALRSSEIESLLVGDVDLDAEYLRVTIRKTGDVDDQPISLDLSNELKRWLRTYAQDLGRPLRSDDALFPRKYGGLISHYEEDESGIRQPVRHPYRWDPSTPVRTTYRIVKDAMQSLGLTTFQEGTHTIRRAVALAYFQQVSQDQGDVAALRETAALLHHSSVATTEIYLGMTPEKNRRDRRIKGKPFMSAMARPDGGAVGVAASK